MVLVVCEFVRICDPLIRDPPIRDLLNTYTQKHFLTRSHNSVESISTPFQTGK